MSSAEHSNPRAGSKEPRSPPSHVLNVVGVAIADQVEGRCVARSVLVQVTVSWRGKHADTDQQSPLESRPEVSGALSDENRRCCSTLAHTRQTVNRSLFPHGSRYLLDRCGPILPEPVAVIVEICCFADSSKHLGLARTGQGILRNQAPRPRLPRLIAKPLAQERPTGSA